MTEITYQYTHMLAPVARPPSELSIYGQDIWIAYEVSWLAAQNMPQFAIGKFLMPAHSRFFLRSGALHKYLTRLQERIFRSWEHVADVISAELSLKVQSKVVVELVPLALDDNEDVSFVNFTGINLDELNTACDTYEYTPSFLKLDKADAAIITEDLFSHLLCFTEQECRHYGSLCLTYTGPKISRIGLLKYIVSLRCMSASHETLIEKIFLDISQRLQPTQLTIMITYLRHRGLSMTTIRSTERRYTLRHMPLYRH